MARVLLIEDELLWQQTFSAILERKGYEVVVVGSFEEAQCQLTASDESSNFALALLDLALEEWSEALQGVNLLPLFEILNKRNRIKVIILTDQNVNSNTIEAARQALFDYKDIVLGTYDKNRLGDTQEFMFLVQQALDEVVKKESWWETADVENFYGRQKELAQLEQKILVERYRLVMLLGVGGIGKSSLVLKLVERINKQFDYVFGRDLRNAPPFSKFIGDALEILSARHETMLPEDMVEAISLLIRHLQKQRCLLVLDNFEGILSGKQRSGQYKEGYEGYKELIQQVVESEHISCLVLTSREKPEKAEQLGETSLVYTTELMGLGTIAGRKILKEKNLFGTDDAWSTLVNRYYGNPWALKLVAGTITELFGGDIESFLSQESIVFGGIRSMLEKQFTQLPMYEREMMYWLAMEQEMFSLKALEQELSAMQPLQHLLDRLKKFVDGSPTSNTVLTNG